MRHRYQWVFYTIFTVVLGAIAVSSFVAAHFWRGTIELILALANGFVAIGTRGSTVPTKK